MFNFSFSIFDMVNIDKYHQENRSPIYLNWCNVSRQLYLNLKNSIKTKSSLVFPVILSLRNSEIRTFENYWLGHLVLIDFQLCPDFYHYQHRCICVIVLVGWMSTSRSAVLNDKHVFSFECCILPSNILALIPHRYCNRWRYPFPLWHCT